MGLLTRPLAGALAILAALAVAAPVAAQPAIESRVKAAYVYKFLGFVRWPAEAASDRTLRVGVFGSDALTIALGALHGRPVADGRIEVTPVETESDVDGCHVLVVGPRFGPQARALLERARGRPVLTVGEAEGFARAGGIVEFVRVGDHVRFEIDLVSAERSGLEIDSRLLRVAAAVYRGGGAEGP